MRTKLVLLAATLAAFATNLHAERKPLPLPHVQPTGDWTEMAETYANSHAKWIVKTQTGGDVVCTVKTIDANGLTCKGPHGTVKPIQRSEIVEVSTITKGDSVWSELLGLGFIDSIGAACGYGVAVIAQLGGAALIAAVPLAFIAAGVVLGTAAMIFDTVTDKHEPYPDKLLFKRPAPEKPSDAALHDIAPATT